MMIAEASEAEQTKKHQVLTSGRGIAKKLVLSVIEAPAIRMLKSYRFALMPISLCQARKNLRIYSIDLSFMAFRRDTAQQRVFEKSGTKNDVLITLETSVMIFSVI